MKKAMKMMDFFFGSLESVFLSLLLLVMIAFSSLQIVLRTGLNQGIVWIDPFLRALVLWTAFIGGAKSVQCRKSIKIDIAERLFNKKIATILDRILSFVAFLVSAFLVWVGIHFVIAEKSFGDVSFLKVKMWHIELAFPVGLALMAIHFGTQVFLPRETEKME